MIEAVFPLVGPLLVFAVALPLAAIVAGCCSRRSVAGDSRRAACPSGDAVRLAGRFERRAARLVHLGELASGRVGRPAGLHRDACARSAVSEAALFALALVFCAGCSPCRGLLREQLAIGLPARRMHCASARGSTTDSRSAAALHPLRKRVVVYDEVSAPIATIGIASPRVVVRTSFADALDETRSQARSTTSSSSPRPRSAPLLRRLVGAGRKPARTSLPRKGAVAMAAGARSALRSRSGPGGRQGIGAGSGPDHRGPSGGVREPALGATDASTLRLRVELLLAYADRAPHHCCRRAGLRFAWLRCSWRSRCRIRSARCTRVVHIASEQAVSLFTGRRWGAPASRVWSHVPIYYTRSTSASSAAIALMTRLLWAAHMGEHSGVRVVPTWRRRTGAPDVRSGEGPARTAHQRGAALPDPEVRKEITLDGILAYADAHSPCWRSLEHSARADAARAAASPWLPDNPELTVGAGPRSGRRSGIDWRLAYPALRDCRRTRDATRSCRAPRRAHRGGDRADPLVRPL